MRPYYPKIRFSALLLAIALLCLMGCRRQPPNELLKWPPTGCRDIDSLMTVFQLRQIDVGSDSVALCIADHMDSVARAKPLPLAARSRAAYCRAVLCFDSGRSLEALRLADDMLALLDSAKAPYDYHAWQQLRVNSAADFESGYRTSIDNLNYARSIGDSLQALKSLTTLFSMAVDIRDTIMAQRYFSAMETILKLPRLKNLRSRMNINRCLMLNNAERNKFLSQLRRDSALMANRQSAIIILQNSFIVDDSVAHLNRALALADDTIQRFRRPILLALKTFHFIDKERPDSALTYGRMARGALPADYPTPWALETYRALSFAFELNGMTDSTLTAMRRVEALNDSLQLERSPEAVIAAENASRVRAVNAAAQADRARILNRSLIVILIAVLILFTIVLLWHRREARHRLERLESDLKLKSANESLRVYAMAMDEHTRLVEDLAGFLDSTSKTDPASAREISTILARHFSDEEMHKAFVKVQAEAGGGFIRRLKDNYPQLSENQLHLAQLIAAGLTNSQLSRILNITVDSVHKSRYRLRRIFSLERKDSLEDFLRRYLE